MILCFLEFYTVKALKNVSNIFVFILIFVCFTNAESNSSSLSLPSKQSTTTTSDNIIIVTPEILFTIPHEGNLIRFECTKNNDVVSWIFPNDEEIHVPINDENFTFTIIHNAYNITKNHLDIIGVKHGMDGRYACILKENTKYNFFIPHIVSDARITKSIMISLSVTGIFCIMCLIVLTIDKYCFSDIDDVKAQTLQKSLRKKNVSSATMTKLEFPA